MALWTALWMALWGPMTAMAVLLCGCNIVPSRNPVGEVLPPAAGSTLAGAPVTLSDALAGAPAVLLVPYTDDAQLDCDAWSLGLAQLDNPIRRFELGVVPSAAGIMLTPAINVDRRSKRAEVLWPEVLCFTGDGADALATQTGLGNAQYARVLLVDATGKIVWFCDQGFTPDRCLALDRHARAVLSPVASGVGSHDGTLEAPIRAPEHPNPPRPRGRLPSDSLSAQREAT